MLSNEINFTSHREDCVVIAGMWYTITSKHDTLFLNSNEFFENLNHSVKLIYTHHTLVYFLFVKKKYRGPFYITIIQHKTHSKISFTLSKQII